MIIIVHLFFGGKPLKINVAAIPYVYHVTVKTLELGMKSIEGSGHLCLKTYLYVRDDFF